MSMQVAFDYSASSARLASSTEALQVGIVVQGAPDRETDVSNKGRQAKVVYHSSTHLGKAADSYTRL